MQGNALFESILTLLDKSRGLYFRKVGGPDRSSPLEYATAGVTKRKRYSYYMDSGQDKFRDSKDWLKFLLNILSEMFNKGAKCTKN